MASILTAVRDLARLREIYVVLVRHGFGELAQRIGFRRRIKPLPASASQPPPSSLSPSSLPPSSLPPSSLPPDVLGGEALPVLDEAVAEVEEQRGEEERRRVSLPERVRLVAMDLGPSFVKLGQLASTRADVVPEAWIAELKKLQDEVNPLPFEEIRDVVETSLGAPLAEIYERFEEKPLAAASIGQVHRAVLKHAEGPKEVAVKVQRPGIRGTVARDLELLHGLAKLVERTVPESRIYSPSALVEQFDRAITSELDFTMEAEHAERFARNFADHAHVRFPRVYKEASSKHVLTLELLPGHKVYEAIREHGHEGPIIARTGTLVVMKMIFEDGFFHADPHPGNILVSGEPSHPVFGLIDLGMVGRLSPEMRDKTVDLMVAAVRQDHVGIADALYAIGTPTKRVDMRAYRAEVAELSEKYVGRPLKEIDLSAMISDLVRGATKYGLEIPPDFLLVGKALMTIEGVGKDIDPNLDVLSVAKPIFLDLLRRRYSPERVWADAWRGLERLSTAAYELPQQAREVLEDLRYGRLTVRTTDPGLPVVVDRLGRRLFAGFVVGAFVIAGTWLLATERSAPLGIGLLGFGVAVMLGHVARDLLRRS